MIYNVNLGKKYDGVETPWIQEFNQFGSFITRDDINQMIKIPHLDDRDTFNLSKLGDGQILPVNSKWVNNGKNLSPSLISIRKEGVEINEAIVYVTLDCSTYKLLKFKATQPVLITYHKDDEYVGCAIVADNAKVQTDTPIVEIWVKDLAENRYKIVSIYLHDSENSIATKIEDAPGKEVKDLSKLDDSRKRRFKVLTNKLITSTIFVDKDEDEKTMKKLTKTMKYANIINIKNLKEKELADLCKKELKDKKVKCITLVNDTDVPYTLWNENRILFVFSYDTEKKRQSCRKSN